MDNDDRQVGRVLSRREVLTLLGVAGGGLAVRTFGRWGTPLLAWTAAARVSTALAQTVAPTCVVRPELTEGPYFVDNQLNRSDIRAEPTDGTIKDGLPLSLAFNVSQIGETCAPLGGATVDVWHCDALGVYSGVTDQGFNTVGTSFLRGNQVTDESGVARFLTIVPGWYQGRTVHIHFKIRTLAAAGGTYEFTSQLFFDDALMDEVLAQPPYSTKAGIRSTRNSNDGIFSSDMLLQPTRSDAGLDAVFAIGLDLSDTAAGAADHNAQGGRRP